MRLSRAVLIDVILLIGEVGLCITVSVAHEPRSGPVDLGAYIMAALIALPARSPACCPTPGRPRPPPYASSSARRPV
jgi:hypothetical protein